MFPTIVVCWYMFFLELLEIECSLAPVIITTHKHVYCISSCRVVVYGRNNVEQTFPLHHHHHHRLRNVKALRPTIYEEYRPISHSKQLFLAPETLCLIPALYNYETPQQTLDFWGKWHVQVGTLLLIVDVSTVKKNRYIDNCFLYQRECKSIYMTQL